MNSDRYDAADNAIKYLEMVHDANPKHKILKDPIIKGFLEEIDFIWIDGQLVKNPYVEHSYYSYSDRQRRG